MQQNNLEQLQDQVQDQRRRIKRLSFYIVILLSAIVGIVAGLANVEGARMPGPQQ